MLQKFKQLPNAEQKILYRKYAYKVLKHWHSWFAFAIFILFAAGGSFIGENFNLIYGIINWGFILGFTIGYVIFLLIFRRKVFKYIAEVL
jgi:hypothetical protein